MSLPTASLLLAIGAGLALGGCVSRSLLSQSESPQAGSPTIVALRARCTNARVIGIEWDWPSPNSMRVDYQVRRNGRLLGLTRTTEYLDSFVEPSTSYTYEIDAAPVLGRRRSSAPLTVRTPADSSKGDAPGCPSRLFAGMRWSWADGYTQANGSDLWPVTWASDGAVYSFFGDGGGFGGDDHTGRTSFGIARLSLSSVVESGPLRVVGTNVYGGFASLHPAILSGKAGSILAVGDDFYAVGGIFGRADGLTVPTALKSGSPDHVELVYSKGNAFSWVPVPWHFCSLHRDKAANGSALRLAGDFCPITFVGFGRANAGAPDGYVYLTGVRNSRAIWRNNPGSAPAMSFLVRVPRDGLRRRSAYEFYAGVDRAGRPRWTPDTRQMQPIFVDRNPDRSGCDGRCDMSSVFVDVVYLPVLRRYLAVAQGRYVAQTSFYEAATLWGPWSVVAYDNIDPATGEGGWAHLGAHAGEALGVHPVCAWMSDDNRVLYMTYSSNGVAPAESSFPPSGTDMDSFNLVKVDLELMPNAGEP